MARIRTIKPDFFTSLTIADLPIPARLTFVGLWTHVDDEGRCVYDPRLIKAAVWPLDDRTAADVDGDVQELARLGLVTLYTVGDRTYLAVSGWREHQRVNRPTPSKLPPPPEPDTETTPEPTPTSENNDSLFPHGELSEPSLNTHRRKGTGNREQGTGNGGGNAGQAPPPKPAKRRATRIPDDFTVTPEMRQWAAEHTPGVDIDHETAKFRDHAHANGRTLKDWTAGWRNWMRNAAKWQPGQRPPLRAVSGGHQPYRNPVDYGDNPDPWQ